MGDLPVIVLLGEDDLTGVLIVVKYVPAPFLEPTLVAVGEDPNVEFVFVTLWADVD